MSVRICFPRRRSAGRIVCTIARLGRTRSEPVTFSTRPPAVTLSPRARRCRLGHLGDPGRLGEPVDHVALRGGLGVAGGRGETVTPSRRRIRRGPRQPARLAGARKSSARSERSRGAPPALGVAEASVELEQLRTGGADHQAGIEDAAEGASRAAIAARRDGGRDRRSPRPRRLRSGHGGVAAHAAGVRSPSSSKIRLCLGGGERGHVLAVADRQQRESFPSRNSRAPRWSSEALLGEEDVDRLARSASLWQMITPCPRRGQSASPPGRRWRPLGSRASSRLAQQHVRGGRHPASSISSLAKAFEPPARRRLGRPKAGIPASSSASTRRQQDPPRPDRDQSTPCSLAAATIASASSTATPAGTRRRPRCPRFPVRRGRPAPRRAPQRFHDRVLATASPTTRTFTRLLERVDRSSADIARGSGSSSSPASRARRRPWPSSVSSGASTR